ncbi:hypothetical protein SESBI_33954 [Sesbania bispinosa]|nr:hypothetical protein SESBI_33954 [Sesbania bispinosa]
MDVRNIAVVVEDVDAARTALIWALHNIIRYGDIITLLHTKVEIVVTEDDREGMKIVATVREIGASMLVVGLHDHSFLYNLAMGHNSIGSYFNCRVLAIKQPAESPLSTMVSAVGVLDSSTDMDFSQIHISRLQVPDTPPPKVKYRICPDPGAIIWRFRRSSRRRDHGVKKSSQAGRKVNEEAGPGDEMKRVGGGCHCGRRPGGGETKAKRGRTTKRHKKMYNRFLLKIFRLLGLRVVVLDQGSGCRLCL